MTTPIAAPMPGGRPTPTRDAAAAGGFTRAVLGWKAVEYAGLALFTVLVPRFMGPTRYGSFAAVLGTVGLFTMIAGMGAHATFGRFVPEYRASGRSDRISQLFTQVFIARVVMAVVLGGVLLVWLPHVLPEASTGVALTAGATVLAAAMSLTCYQLFYGFNRLSRWLAREALVRPTVVVLLLTLGGTSHLGRAVLAMLLGEAVFLVVGLGWSGRYLSRQPWEGGWRDLAAHVRFGLYFFGASLLLMAVWRGGELTVLVLSTAREQVGYYNLANAIAMALGSLIGQLASMLVPHIATLHVAGDGQRADAWLGYSLKYLTICTFVFVLVVDAVGETFVRVVLGEAYLPVVPNLRVLAVGLLPLALVRTAVSQATVHKEPGRALAVAGAGLVTFVVMAVLLVPRLGALGASISVAGALGAAGLVSYRQPALREAVNVARFWRVVVPGVPAITLAVLPGIPAIFGAALGLVLYGALLVGAGAVTLDELRQVARAVTERT